MHLKSRRLSSEARYTPWTAELALLLFVSWWMQFFAVNPYVAAATPGCENLTCRLGEQCVNRKFWCNYTPCPNMVYCSKDRKESLKGPESCETVLCPTGFKCMVRLRDCKWNQNCKLHTARCVTEREYHDEPSTCADVVCPKGHRCVLRETYCPEPPCKLTKSCARTADVFIWYERCREIGCRSEHDCFLRRPAMCSSPPCYHEPDCLAKFDFYDEESTLDEYCYGWICPADQECSAHAEAPCKHGNCRIIRSCHEPLLPPLLLASNATLRRYDQPEAVLGPRATLSDIEKETFLDEQRRLLSKVGRDTQIKEFYSGLGASPYKNPDQASVKSKRVTTIPNLRSAPDESPWLTYLKRKAGAEAVQYWMDKAKKDGDYEDFVKWLESVAGLLGPETYQQWLREVALASAHVPEFQSWISPWNRSPHRSGLSPRQPDLAVAAAAGRSSFDIAEEAEAAREPLPGSLIQRAKTPYYGQQAAVPSQAQELLDSVKNSWQPWEMRFPAPPTDPPRQQQQQPQQQPQIFFPDGQNSGFGKAPPLQMRSNQWPAGARPDGLPMHRVDAANLFAGQSGAPGYGRAVVDSAPEEFKSMLGQITGLQQQFPQIPSILKMDSSQMPNPPRNNDGEIASNFLVFFPPPLNFVIYYQNQSTVNSNNNVSQITTSDQHQEHETRLSSFANENISADSRNKNYKIDNHMTQMPIGSSDAAARNGSFERPGKTEGTTGNEQFDKRKELQYVRKVIKELLNYWDSEESRKEKNEFVETTPTNAEVPTERPQEDTNKDITFAEFVKWLKNNKDNLTSFEQSRHQIKPLHTTPEKTGISINSNSVRVLIDVDKNPELLEALLERSKSNSRSRFNDGQQISVDLKDFVDPQEEDIVSRKLMDIAKNHLHRNLTENQMIPKTLWVFPIYNEAENNTLISKMGNANEEITTTTMRVTYKNIEETTASAREHPRTTYKYNRKNNRNKKERAPPTVRRAPKPKRKKITTTTADYRDEYDENEEPEDQEEDEYEEKEEEEKQERNEYEDEDDYEENDDTS